MHTNGQMFYALLTNFSRHKLKPPSQLYTLLAITADKETFSFSLVKLTLQMDRGATIILGY